MAPEPPICECLRAVLDYEMAHDNLPRKAEMRPNLGRTVVFFQQLKIWGTPATGDIPKGVRYWDAADPPEAGWHCPEHQCLIVGPTVD
jgi:hypothetical protein